MDWGALCTGSGWHCWADLPCALVITMLQPLRLLSEKPVPCPCQTTTFLKSRHSVTIYFGGQVDWVLILIGIPEPHPTLPHSDPRLTPKPQSFMPGGPM